jgi:16S rRNA processing protein RimM
MSWKSSTSDIFGLLVAMSGRARLQSCHKGETQERALAPVAPNPEPTGAFITLARVVKTQGRYGEVAAEVHSDVPDRFAIGMKLFVLPSADRATEGLGKKTSREWVSLEIEDFWPHKRLLIFKFRGVDSMSDAEMLIGVELQVPRVERAELEQGWTYVSDLIGCAVTDHGEEIGRLEDVQFGAGEAPVLLVLDQAGKKFDIPFAEAYLEGVDIAQKQVRMNLPEGMLEINAPLTMEEKQQQARPEKRKKH